MGQTQRCQPLQQRDGHGDPADSSSSVHKQPFQPGLCVNRRASLLRISLGSQHGPCGRRHLQQADRPPPAPRSLGTGPAAPAWLALVTSDGEEGRLLLQIRGSGYTVGLPPTRGSKETNQNKTLNHSTNSALLIMQKKYGYKVENRRCGTLPKSPAKDRMSFSISM